METFPEAAKEISTVPSKRNLSMKNFRGTYTVMITPFAASGEVDVEADGVAALVGDHRAANQQRTNRGEQRQAQ